MNTSMLAALEYVDVLNSWALESAFSASMLSL